MSSTISPLPSSVSGFASQPVAETANAPAVEAPKQNYTPLWMVRSAASNSGLDGLGIRAPNANGDLAVLLAQASLSLENTADENRKNRDLALLSTLSRVLADFNANALQLDRDNKGKMLAETKATQAELATAVNTPVNANTPSLLDQQRAQTAIIDTQRSTIKRLTEELENPKLTPEQRKGKNEELKTAQETLGTAIARRTSVDISLADARVTSLSSDVTALQAEIARDPNLAALEAKTNERSAAEKTGDEGRVNALTDEIEALQAKIDANPVIAALPGLLAAKTTERDKAQAALVSFKENPQTPASLDAFSANTRSGVVANLNDLASRAATVQTAQTDASNALDTALSGAMKAAASAGRQVAAAISANSSTDARHDATLEQNFDAITEGDLDADERVRSRLSQDQVQDAASRERVEQAAAVLLQQIADVVGMLSAQVDALKEPMPVPPPMVASRVRVGV